MRENDISVIIPTYNRAEMLCRAIESVYRQTCSPGELIIVDDGSTDHTAAIAGQFVRRGPFPARYLKISNSGPAAARNRGIEAAKGGILAFLDSDDHWHRKKLEIQYGKMKENRTYLVSHTREKWYRNGKHLNQKKIHHPRHGDIFDHCLQLCCVGMSTVMINKSLLLEFGCFNESFPCCEDYDLWLRMSVYQSFLLVDHSLTIKEGGRTDQVSWQYRIGMDKLRIMAIENIFQNELLDLHRKKAACLELVKKCTIYGNGCRKHGKKSEGDSYLEKADAYRSILEAL